MKRILKWFPWAALASVLLVAGGFVINGNVAWVAHRTFEVRSEQFSNAAKCELVHYTGFNFGDIVVSGHVPLGGSSGAYGGYLLRANYSLPGHMFYNRETAWGGTSFYGNLSVDQRLMIASACEQR